MPYDKGGSHMESVTNMKRMNLDRDFQERPEWFVIHEAAKDFIKRCLAFKKENRFSAKQALAHPWIVHGGRMPDDEEEETTNLYDTIHEGLEREAEYLARMQAENVDLSRMDSTGSNASSRFG